jgi:hypothetical protein
MRSSEALFQWLSVFQGPPFCRPSAWRCIFSLNHSFWSLKRIFFYLRLVSACWIPLECPPSDYIALSSSPLAKRDTQSRTRRFCQTLLILALGLAAVNILGLRSSLIRFRVFDSVQAYLS